MDVLKPEPWRALYDRGCAVGHSNIMNDLMTFRFRDEVFEFPAIKVLALARYNGYFYECPVEKLRELKVKNG